MQDSGKNRARWWGWPVFALALVALLSLGSCGGDTQTPSGSEQSASTIKESTIGGDAGVSDVEEPTELADGSYSCEAINATRGKGPYSLECDKSGDTITIHFANGGHIDLDIDSQDLSGEDSWEITATSAESGDEWNLTIDE